MRNPIPKDQLTKAIAGARSWRVVNTTLGRMPEASTTNLKKQAAEYEIDIAHLAGANRRTYTDDQLRDAVGSSTTWAEVATKLGKSTRSGASRAVMRKTAAKLHLDVTELEANAGRRRGGGDGTRTREGNEPQPD